jgi:putative heme-binding domain-containing protein
MKSDLRSHRDTLDIHLEKRWAQLAFLVLASILLIPNGFAQERGSKINIPPSPTAKTEREWIWHSDSETQSRQGDVFFRRVMDLPDIEQAIIEFEADDLCEVFVNGRRVGATKAARTIERADVTTAIRPGKNIVAIRASNRIGNDAGLKVGFMFKPSKSKWRIVVSDSEWKTSKLASQNWQLMRFDDSSWLNAMSLDAPGRPSAKQEQSSDHQPSTKTAESAKTKTKPVVVSLGDYDSSKGPPPVERFVTKPGFVVDEVLDRESIGSTLAMAFNEFGHIIASQEGGPLVLVYDADKDGTPEKIRTYCELIQNVQGILPLNGDVYVTGDGPDGSGLYRLIDEDRNGELEKSETLLKFKGAPGEHGPHQIAFGPDGCIYIVVGNHAKIDAPIDESSPYRIVYEGDIVQPRFQDPGGHADGIQAPGGTVVRLELATKRVQLVSGGLRNAYDLTFHPSGALYLHDSDMEADIGSVWHRATSLFRVVEGAEFGWRSGWANWPEYYIDRLPSIASSGRGSPTGITTYTHFKYPAKYHRAIFSADWSEGRILWMNVESPDRSKSKFEEFVSGSPMNVTDLEVGPDGWLYFSTGGRGTDGGIYRVRWVGEIPEQVMNLGEGIARAIRQPQIYSAYGRQAAAVFRKELGSEWAEQIAGVAYSSENPARYRMQALDLMQLLGPIPTTEMLIELSNSSSEMVQVKCARLLGLHSGDSDAEMQLRKLLRDKNPNVRVAACESILRQGIVCSPAELKPLLTSNLREERFAGRCALAIVPTEKWKNAFLAEASNRLVINSGLALITAEPSVANAVQIVDAMTRQSESFVSDSDFVDMLRVLQVTLHLASPDQSALTKLKMLVEKEFPAGNSAINCELIRLATFLKCDVVPQAIKYLQSDVPMPERMLISMHLPMIKHEWTSIERMTVLQFLEAAQQAKGGSSYQLYVMKTSQLLAEHLTESEAIRILEMGEKYPNAALTALFKAPEQLNPDQVQTLIQLDTSIDKGGLEDDVFKRLKTGITAVMSRQKDDKAIEHLRQRWRKSPDRRATIALALAQTPDERNWDYLVRSIGLLDSFAVADVCETLKKIDVATEDPEALRQTILQGCKLVEAGLDPSPTIRLMEYWTGETLDLPTDKKQSPMAAWQKWYEIRFPDLPPAILPASTEQPRWSLGFLEQFLTGDQGKFGASENGAKVFAKAQCTSCHKMNSIGNGFGPDLTSVTRRFTRSEFLESTLFPSHVISDQYASKKVLTTSGQVYVGIIVRGPSGITVRTKENKEIQIPEGEVDEVLPSKVSAMPAGLLDDLTPTEIRDLLCYIGYLPQERLAEDGPTTIRR